MEAASALEKQVTAEQNDYDAENARAADELEKTVDAELADGTAKGEDPEAGKLFEVPRVAVLLDETDPTVLKLAFSGSIELERTNPDDVAFYNGLVAGKTSELKLELHVAGPKTAHRRDSDGNVDAVVQTKSLVVASIVDV